MPPTPEAIRLDRARLKESYAQAWQIRSHYNIFDQAADLGRLIEGVESLFAPGGFWLVP